MERIQTSKESRLTNLILGIEILAVGAVIGFVAYQDYRKYVDHSASKERTEQVQDQYQRNCKTD